MKHENNDRLVAKMTQSHTTSSHVPSANLPALSAVVALLYVLPLSLNIGSFGGKPIDLAAPNLLLVVLPFLALKLRSLSALALFGFLLPFLFLVIGAFSSFARGGEVEVILSTFSFVLPFFHIYVGFIIGRSKLGFSFLYISYALSLVIIAIFLSDLVLGDFPRGCGFQGRWGGCIGQLEVYGFPNSSMNFLAVCSPLLALPLVRKSAWLWRLLALLAIVGLAIIVPLSLSRSALLVFSISSVTLLFIILGVLTPLVLAILAIFVIFSYEWVISLEIFARIARRIQATIEAGDITTGRLGIWKNALSIWLESPLFGKAFVSFSNFSKFGTVHQQYLELLYKSGIIGFAAFFGYIFAVAHRSFKMLKYSGCYTKNDQIVFIAFGVCLFVANLFQPAISYQPMGGFLFFAMGVFLAKNRQNFYEVMGE